MEHPVIQDDSAEATWFVNSGNYTFVDPTTGVRFEPRTPVRTKSTAWVVSQPVIQPYEFPAEKVEEPVAEDPPAPPAKPAKK